MSNARLYRKRYAALFKPNSPDYDPVAGPSAQAAAKKNPHLKLWQLERLAYRYRIAPAVTVRTFRPSIFSMFLTFISDVVTLKYFKRGRSARRLFAGQKVKVHPGMAFNVTPAKQAETLSSIFQSMRR